MAKKLDECAYSMRMNRSAFLEWLLSNSLPLVPNVAKIMEDIFRKGLEDKRKRKK